VIVPDINLLIYAHNSDAPFHSTARAWWETLLNDGKDVRLPWAVVFGFVRLVTHPRVLVSPLSADRAVEIAEGWLTRPRVDILEPGPRHLAIARKLFVETGVGANLTTDTHLAALAIEHQCEIHSNDSDFGRFPGLRWVNPIRG
jgi:uncharacterized protein